MDDIEKSRYGRYEDNAKNRRLHRVGQEYGSKKQENEPSKSNKPTLDEIRKEINELGNILRGRIKDGRHTEDVEKRISEMLQQTTDLTLKNTLENFEKFTKLDTFANIISRLVNDEIKRRKTEEKEKAVLKESTEEENKAQSEEPETYTRVKFDDVPNSGKINLKKYLSDKVRKGVDEKWSNIKNIPTENLKKMEKGLVNDLNKNFEAIKKSQRAELLYSIMKVKGELSKRSKETKNEEKQGEQPASKTEPIKEGPKKEHKKPESFNELYTRIRESWADIMETKPREVDFTKPKEVAEMAAALFPETEVSKIDGEEEYMVQYPGDANRFMRIDKFTKSPKALMDKIRLFLSMDMDIRTKQNFSSSDLEKLDRLFEIVSESVTDRVLAKDISAVRTKEFKEQVAENNKKIFKNVGIKQGKPMSFEEANQGRGNPKFFTDDLYRVNCQTCVVVHELRLRGFDLGAKPKTSPTQNAMSIDSTFAWIDPLTGQQPEATKISCAPDNRIMKVRKSKKSKSDLRKNILAATKEPGRYNFSYGWVCGKDSSGHIITAERYADGNLTFYDPQIGKMIPIIQLLDEVSPKYMCYILRVDNLLIKPDIVKDYAMHYE